MGLPLWNDKQAAEKGDIDVTSPMKIPVIYQLHADFFFFFFLETRHTDNNNHVSGATTREFWHSLTWYISR